MSICGKNITAFYGTGKMEQRIAKSFKSFIYFLICRNLCADCYILSKLSKINFFSKHSAISS